MPGGLGYWVQEWGYEKNVHPHVARSSVMAIGDRARILKRLFLLAANFPGGMLQLRSGNGSAKHMLDKWIAELNNPWVYPQDSTIFLGCSNSGWYDAVTSATKSRVVDVLEEFGHHDVVEKIEKGQRHIEINLAETFPALAKMTEKRPGDRDDINSSEDPPYAIPWKLIREHSVNSAAGAYKEVHEPNGKSPTEVEPLQIYSISWGDDRKYEHFSVLRGDQTLSAPDAMCSLEGEAISNCWEQERDAPGQYREMYKALHKAKEQIKPLPPGSVISCSKVSPSVKPWMTAAICEIQRELGISVDEAGFSVTYSDALQKISLNGFHTLLTTLRNVLKIELPSPPQAAKVDDPQLELLLA
jgi:hypothetical protein